MAAPAKLIAGRGFLEVRRTVLKPERRAGFLASLTPARRPGLLATLVPELGADAHEVITLQAHASYDERDERERARGPFAGEGEAVRAERSEVFVEAIECLVAAGADARGAAAFAPRARPAPPAGGGASRPVYEWREYQLVLGYNPFPKLREAFVAGLPSKVAADPLQRAELAMMGWTDVGPLNRFVELWRYASMQEAMAAREAARGSKEWRETIGAVAPMVQSFSTAFYSPAPRSPWQ
jgi:hypothetical protein